MEEIKIKDLGVKLSAAIEDDYKVVTNKDEIELENEKKIFFLIKTEDLENDEKDEVVVYQAELNNENNMIEPFSRDNKEPFALTTKNKEDLILLIL